MQNLLTFHYWFDLRPGALNPRAQFYYAIFLGLLVLAAIILTVLKRAKKGIFTKIFFRLYNFSISNFIIGLFLLFFTYEALPFLSMRFWFLIWFLGVLTWLGFIFYQISRIPKIKEENEKIKEFNKYIP